LRETQDDKPERQFIVVQHGQAGARSPNIEPGTTKTGLMWSPNRWRCPARPQRHAWPAAPHTPAASSSVNAHAAPACSGSALKHRVPRSCQVASANSRALVPMVTWRASVVAASTVASASQSFGVGTVTPAARSRPNFASSEARAGAARIGHPTVRNRASRDERGRYYGAPPNRQGIEEYILALQRADALLLVYPT
jgi:hypothetical protein